MRGLPNMRVLVPADYAAAVAAICLAAETPGPVYVRMGRASVPAVYADGVELELGRAYTLRGAPMSPSWPAAWRLSRPWPPPTLAAEGVRRGHRRLLRQAPRSRHHRGVRWRRPAAWSSQRSTASTAAWARPCRVRLPRRARCPCASWAWTTVSANPASSRSFWHTSAWTLRRLSKAVKKTLKRASDRIVFVSVHHYMNGANCDERYEPCGSRAPTPARRCPCCAAATGDIAACPRRFRR